MENQFEVQRSLGRIEGGISELKADIFLIRTDHTLLREEFNKLEAGRLTKMESEFATFRALAHVKARNTAVFFSSVIAVIISVVTAFILRYLNI